MRMPVWTWGRAPSVQARCLSAGTPTLGDRGRGRGERSSKSKALLGCSMGFELGTGTWSTDLDGRERLA
eukprot:scaffold3808_cov222-Pinguiococcus_pyrenoidosus.AAC.6